MQLRQLQTRLQREELGQDDQELIFTETSKDLSDLIVYCRASSIKPWDWGKQKATTVSQMFSFGEPTAIELCKRWPRGKSLSVSLSLIFLSPSLSLSESLSL